MGSTRQLIALALALVLTGGVLAGTVHHVTVEHEVCSVHGEITHADDHHQEFVESAVPSVHDIPDGEHEHDCTLTTLSRAADPEVPEGAFADVRAMRPADYLPGATSAPRAGSVLASAPKTSPPA